MKHHRILGADAHQVQEIYEQTVLSTLRPKVVLGLACARDKAYILLADGNVYDFPRGQSLRLVAFPERARGRVTQISAGDNHFVALTNHLVWNVYTWGSSTAAEGVFGRDIHGEESARTPDVVRDIPGRVIKVSCGSNFTMCATATGELWGFGPPGCSFGQSPFVNNSTKKSHVVKIFWGSEGEYAERNEVGGARGLFGASGRFGFAAKRAKSKTEEAMNGLVAPAEGKPVTEDDLEDLFTSEVPPAEEWFFPSNPKEALLLRYAQSARERSFRHALDAIRMREKRQDTILRLSMLTSRVIKQESRTEMHARTMIPFNKSGQFDIPSRLVERESALKRQSSQEGDGEEEETASDLASKPDPPSIRKRMQEEGFRPLKVVVKKQHQLSKIRNKLQEERLKEEEIASRDAAVCAGRLADSISLLSILKRDQAEGETDLSIVTKTLRETEMAAKDWRTRALLLERTMLRLKRETRGSAAFKQQTGECVIYPSAAWNPALSASLTVRGFLKDAKDALSEPVLWLRARMDPDWGLRINVIKLTIVFRDGFRIPRIERILASKEPVDFQHYPGLVVSVKQSLTQRATQHVLTFDLQRHAVIALSQMGEDTNFYLGFVIPNSNVSLVEDLARFVLTITLNVEGDGEVAERIVQEVEEKGDFARAKTNEWEETFLEVL